MFIVYDKNMNKKDFPTGVRPLDIFISSIQKRTNTSEIEGRSGKVTYGQTDGNRPIEISLLLEASDTRDYRLLRDSVFSFFDDEFYISELYERGKRYKVSVVESYIPERMNFFQATAEFSLDITELPYAESIGTTQDIQSNGIDSEGGLWGFGMGLSSEDQDLIYTHESNAFSIFNAGNVPIHPFEQYLKITISNVVGSTSYLELVNNTNGSTFKVNETVSNAQTIVIDGPRVTSNDLAYLRKTNRKFIELSPGRNEFILNGAISAKIEFDTRFYYR